MEFAIRTKWNSEFVDHEPITVALSSTQDGVRVTITAPFFNSPPAPGGKPGEPFPQLWDYEVVEVFFLNDDDQYVEVELCPHGQHLVLLLNGIRKPVKDELPLKFKVTTDGNKWQGEAVIPSDYFPPKVSKFNAYAIHGEGEGRVYEALNPVPNGAYSNPDFHRLDVFQSISFQDLLPRNHEMKDLSNIWTS
ncbi:hypothetical protein NP493_17g00019 [Ridgeia piscesae]|uniref:Uncharacterized protein n=1 Tax=Ridgeia piscesae TaxID=27915 RepID=A0AAD9PE62_RIDPI|nr:hypothetical protein NP493_17g00019 [Ridgeia piscesae]